MTNPDTNLNLDTNLDPNPEIKTDMAGSSRRPRASPPPKIV
jgi:hypothetical protein